MGVTGVRVGRTMRVVSRFVTAGVELACSGRGGSAIRTVSFLGSAMAIKLRSENRTKIVRLSLVKLGRDGAPRRPRSQRDRKRTPQRGVPTYASRS